MQISPICNLFSNYPLIVFQFNHNMPAFNQEIEDRINEALATIPEDGVVNLAKVAREFAVDYCALRRRYHGIPPTTSKGGHNSRLDDAQDAALCKRIKQ